MLLKRLYDTKLAQASYLLGCQRTGSSLVVDPNRDVAQYLAAAKAEGLRITHVTETHIHADFVSGARELAALTGAKLLLSGEGGPDWQYAYAAEAGATLLKDRDVFKVGNPRVEVRHTPGHTPEHLTFIVTDAASTDRPMGAFTGDFIFVGDVGRPDLLERAAGHAGTMEAGARALFRSLQAFKALPDYLQIWPGHGAGSACGKALGAVPSSTLGYERFANWGLATENEEDFVAMVLAGQPEPPRYFARMKQVNRDGPAPRGTPGPLPSPGPERLAEVLATGAVVVDLRSTREFADRHVPGTINIPASQSFATYAGSVLREGARLYLLGDERRIADARHDLALIGVDDVAGAFGLEALALASQRTPQLLPADLAPRLGTPGLLVLDVRGRSEWDAGHLSDAVHVPLGELPERMGELPAGAEIVVNCATGSRSAIAASLLRAAGRHAVSNLKGGYDAWMEYERGQAKVMK